MRSILILLVLGGMIMLTSCNKETPSENTSVVIVGMRNSAKFGSCPGSDVDANTMISILSKYTNNIKVLLNNQAKKSSVISALNEAIKSDLCIFYYSGHGGSEPFSDTRLDKTETDGKDEYLCLYDTYMRDNEIWSIINQSKGKVMLIFDCCHSETMFREPIIVMRSAELAKNNISARGINMLCWSGCPDNTYSYGDNNGGMFTNTLKKWYDKDYSYETLWKKISMDHSLKEYEKVRKTQLGTGFNCKVFK